ncbi:hypothetical protein [Buttiauxella agrestis]|uniref:hypothetical protein n=1 Tax=Buttiauxella agrestis TaxID=82977 RepID=UPI0015606E85|nr:hypothetical protein [Buttiauxella agrestis]BCG07788.1 hypothetical protein BADSM9389_04140 [Buttiauxella agrestis]
MTEQDLLDAGFTVKELKILNQNIEAVKGVTYESLLRDLSKRFWGGVICLFLILLPTLSSILQSNPLDMRVVYANAGIIIFGIIVIYFVIPMKLAIKARQYIKQSA